MTAAEPVVPGTDVTTPSVARVYGFRLGGNDNFGFPPGGKDNFAADRGTGGRTAERNPSLPRLVRDNGRFLCAAGARAAAAVKTGN